MLLYFARHGESVANVRHAFSNRGAGGPLTDRGQQQALDLAERLRGKTVQTIFSSPLLRARQTANVLGAALSIPAEVTEALREWDVGRLEGRSDDAAWEEYSTVRRRWAVGDSTARLPGGESLVDIDRRRGDFLRQVARGQPEGNVLFLGHGGLYAAVLPLVLANVDSEFAGTHPIDHAAYVLVERQACDLVAIEWSGLAMRV